MNFVVQGSCTRDGCTYKHARPANETEEKYYRDLHVRLASRSKSPGPKRRSKGESVCKNWKRMVHASTVTAAGTTMMDRQQRRRRRKERKGGTVREARRVGEAERGPLRQRLLNLPILDYCRNGRRMGERYRVFGLVLPAIPRGALDSAVQRW